MDSAAANAQRPGRQKQVLDSTHALIHKFLSCSVPRLFWTISIWTGDYKSYLRLLGDLHSKDPQNHLLSASEPWNSKPFLRDGFLSWRSQEMRKIAKVEGRIYNSCSGESLHKLCLMPSKLFKSSILYPTYRDKWKEMETSMKFAEARIHWDKFRRSLIKQPCTRELPSI